MKFIMGTDEIEFSVPASYPYGQVHNLVQVADKTAAGTTVVEDYSVRTKTLTVSFPEMPEADYLLLLDWHVNKAEGQLNEFTMVDDLGVSYDVIFTSSEIDATLNDFGYWDVSFSVEEVQ